MPGLLQTKSKFWCALEARVKELFVSAVLLVYSVIMARILMKWWKSVALLQLAHHLNELGQIVVYIHFKFGCFYFIFFNFFVVNKQINRLV